MKTIVEKCQAIMNDYLPPDGISKDEFISRIIFELDNPTRTIPPSNELAIDALEDVENALNEFKDFECSIGKYEGSAEYTHALSEDTVHKTYSENLKTIRAALTAQLTPVDLESLRKTGCEYYGPDHFEWAYNQALDDTKKLLDNQDLNLRGVLRPGTEDKQVDSDIVGLVNKQAEDDGLWFDAQTAPEAYLQQELRRLHAVIERGE